MTRLDTTSSERFSFSCAVLGTSFGVGFWTSNWPPAKVIHRFGANFWSLGEGQKLGPEIATTCNSGNLTFQNTPSKTYHYTVVFGPLFCCKVRSFLQWAKAARTGPKKPLVVNMGETCMKLNHGRNRGLMISKQTLPPGKKRKKEQISSGEAKCCVSFLAFLTHDSTVQPKLPQIVLSNKKAISLGMLHTLLAGKPHNIRIWRENSGWTNHQVFRRLMSLLMQCLAEYVSTHQVILVVDVAKAHFHSTIFAHANKLGLRLVYVPAKLTWLLQPADTHCFSRFKAQLRKRWLQLRVASEDGKVSPTQWLLAVFEVVQKVLCASNGFLLLRL